MRSEQEGGLLVTGGSSVVSGPPQRRWFNFVRERLLYRVAPSGERMHTVRVEDAFLTPTSGLTLPRF